MMKLLRKHFLLCLLGSCIGLVVVNISMRAGLLLIWLGCQIFMCLSSEVAAVTSLVVRKALYTAEEEVSFLPV